MGQLPWEARDTVTALCSTTHLQHPLVQLLEGDPGRIRTHIHAHARTQSTHTHTHTHLKVFFDPLGVLHSNAPQADDSFEADAVQHFLKLLDGG